MTKPKSAKRGSRALRKTAGVAKRKRAPKLKSSGDVKSAAPSRRSAWTVQDARANFSALIDGALAGRPQEIYRAGKEAVVVVSAKDYKALAKPKKSLDELFRNSPLTEIFGQKGIPEVTQRERLRDIDFGD